MTNFKVNIISDTVCPWCYVGKKRLDQAIELYRRVYPGGKDDTFTVSWFPFYLDPTSPKVGIPLRERMAMRFGADAIPRMHERLTTIGSEVGISFKFDARIGNTRDSHRVIQLGKTKGSEVENKVVLELFKSYFEGNGDITSWDDLTAAAEKAGLDRGEVREWLESGKGGAEVDAEVKEAQARDIHGVPHFTVQDRYEIGGAQTPEEFLQVFDQIKRAEAK
ncbi:DSBA oxidoreductase [Microdochium bolleyi]|uniref:DSBA oxidoreductase n=1 Tax=Microdochium bolleyi TaxID=196109 RepID=A0A136IZF2_9PEZI|nr:DSBA oxidoreductase [Microdochium bolleyi]